MTVGEGIVWSTVILVAFASVYFIGKSRKWKLVGKICGGIIVLGCVLAGGVWAWEEYKNRPQIVEELAGVSFGMTPLEVRLTKGEPDLEDNDEGTGSFRVMYKDGSDYLLVFFKIVEDESRAHMVCSNDYRDEIFGLGKYDSERDVLKKLGEPEHTSVKSDGLSKHISYPEWNASYEIETGRVTGVCIKQSGPVVFADEYDS